MSIGRLTRGAAVAVVMVLAACGGDGGDDEAGPADDGAGQEEVAATSTEPVEAPPSLWILTPTSDQVHQVDPETGEVRASIDVGTYPNDVAVGFGAVWVSNAEDGSVSRIDPATAEVTDTYDTSDANAVAVGEDVVWVARQSEPSVVGLDPETGEIVEEVALGSEQWPNRLQALDDGTLVAIERYSGGLLHIDPASGEVRHLPFDVVVPDVLAVDDQVYVSLFLDPPVIVDLASFEVVESLDSEESVEAFADDHDGSSVWVTLQGSPGLASRLDLGTGSLAEPVEVSDNPLLDLIVTDDVVWVIDQQGGLFRLDPDTGEVVATAALPSAVGATTASAAS